MNLFPDRGDQLVSPYQALLGLRKPTFTSQCAGCGSLRQRLPMTQTAKGIPMNVPI